MRTFSISLAVLALLLTSGMAIAQSCVTLPAWKLCVNKYPKIDGRQPGYGGLVSCKSSTPNNIQYDYYVWIAGYGYYYACSFPKVPCAGEQQSDPAAYAAFCT